MRLNINHKSGSHRRGCIEKMYFGGFGSRVRPACTPSNFRCKALIT